MCLLCYELHTLKIGLYKSVIFVAVFWIRAGCVPFVRLLLAGVESSVVVLWR